MKYAEREKEIIKTDRHLIKKGRFMYIGRQYEYGGVANAICNYTIAKILPIKY